MNTASDRLFVPAFRQRRLGLLFGAIVAIVVYIATLAIAAGVALSSTTLSWDQGMKNRLTVEIPAVEDESSTPQAERVRQALAVLRADAGVKDAAPVPDDEVARLLKPWIRDAELLKKLPVPVLISVERREGSPLTAAEIEDRLKPVVKDARADDHAAWLADLSRFIRSLAAVAGLMVVLTALTLLIAVNLICRAVMATEHDTIALLHVMGADDGIVARHFQMHTRRLSWPAALTGFLLALASLGGLLFFLRDVIDPLSLPPSNWLALMLLVLLVPFATVRAATLAARIEALRLLRAGS